MQQNFRRLLDGAINALWHSRAAREKVESQSWLKPTLHGLPFLLAAVSAFASPQEKPDV